MELPISILNLDDFISQVKTSLRVKDFVVYNLNYSNYTLGLNTPHRSNFFSVTLVEKGVSQFTVNDQKYEIKASEILLSPISEIFSVNLVSKEFKSKMILFTADSITNSGYNYKSNNLLKSLSNRSSQIILNKELYEILKFCIARLEALNDTDRDDYYYNELTWYYFSLLAYEIDNYYKKTDTIIATTSRDESITTSFFILLRENYMKQHDVQFYADQLFITRKYLSKVIKKTMLRSTRDIINQVLITEAKVLLKGRNASVSHIAMLLNFSDHAVFSKFFKKHTGQTPSDYRKNDLY